MTEHFSFASFLFVLLVFVVDVIQGHVHRSAHSMKNKPKLQATGPATGTAVKLVDDATNNGAVCIDGSPAVYYLGKTNSSESLNKWVVYFEGGGWCSHNTNAAGTGFDSCLARSTTTLGSSSTYADTMSFGGSDQVGNNPSTNPLMYDWNKAYLKYCDGASFGGNRLLPQNVTNSDGNIVPLYSRGHRILKAVYNDLLNIQGMNNATDIVITGCSAGGLSTWLHSDWIKDNLLNNLNNKDARISALPDSGFFIDYNGYTGNTNYSNGMKWVFNNGNMSYGSINSDCINNYGGKDSSNAYNCVFAQNIAPFVDIDLFVLNSEYDAWQTSNILGSTANDTINEYGKNFTEIIYNNFFNKNSVENNNNNRAGYIDSCHHHCGDWDQLPNGNYTQATAHHLFYINKVVNKDSNVYVWNQNQTYPCNSCC